MNIVLLKQIGFISYISVSSYSEVYTQTKRSGSRNGHSLTRRGSSSRTTSVEKIAMEMKLSGTKRAERLYTVYSPAKNSTTGSNSRTTQSSLTYVWPKPPSRPRPTAAYTRSSGQKPERDSHTNNSDTRRRSIAPERDAVRTSPRESSPPQMRVSYRSDFGGD